MRFSFQQTGLLAGMMTVITSALFFGRQQGIYQLLLLAGLLLAGVCFLWMIVGKGTATSKWIWTGMVAFGIGLNGLTENHFCDLSYRIYLYQHQQELAEITTILQNKPGEIFLKDDSLTERNGAKLSPFEKGRLVQAKRKLGLYWLWKSDSTIYVGLWGFLDVQLGLTYAISGKKPQEQSRQLTGNWYR